MADRYISVKSLKAKLNYIFRVCGTSKVVKETVIEGINRLSSADVVEVVRCKDCKYSKQSDVVLGVEDFKCLKHNISCLSADDYCSYGEGREE